MDQRPESREKLQLLNADAGIEVNDFEKGSSIGLPFFLQSSSQNVHGAFRHPSATTLLQDNR